MAEEESGISEYVVVLTNTGWSEWSNKAVPLRLVCAALYAASNPFGMGRLHYVEGDASEQLVEHMAECAVRGGFIDYASGRMIKVGFSSGEAGLSMDLRLRHRDYSPNTDFPRIEKHLERLFWKWAQV